MLRLLKRRELDAIVLAFPHLVEDVEYQILAEDTLWLAILRDEKFKHADYSVVDDIEGCRMMLLYEGYYLRDQTIATLGKEQVAM